MNDCCEICKRKVRIEKWDYNEPGVRKTSLKGYGCLAMLNEGLVIQMIGTDEWKDTCEMFEEKE